MCPSPPKFSKPPHALATPRPPAAAATATAVPYRRRASLPITAAGPSRHRARSPPPPRPGDVHALASRGTGVAWAPPPPTGESWNGGGLGVAVSLGVVALVVCAVAAAASKFDGVVEPSWANDHVVYEGDLLKLRLDSSSGGGFASKNKFLYGKVTADLKLVPGDSFVTSSLRLIQHVEIVQGAGRITTQIQREISESKNGGI